MADEASIENEVKSRSALVSNLLSESQWAKALQASLENPPVNSKEDETKAANTSIVEKVLSSTTEANLYNALGSLSAETCDVLMKYVYKIMGEGPKVVSYNTLLKLHAKLVEKAGYGSILRVMSDRKTV